MKRPNDILIKRVLNETATRKEASEVAAWFTTPEGQAWLSGQFDEDADFVERGVIPSVGTVPTEELLRRIDRTIGRMRWRRILFRAAAVLIPCVLILGLWADLNSRLGGALFAPAATKQVSAVLGERKEIIFQDGTKVFLNAGSTISYPERFGLAERRVALNGEAFFEVTHNPRRPFIVETGNSAIRVLGTSFDVRAYGDDPTIDVVLLEGSVEFTQGKERYRLSPSQKLVFDKQSGTGTVSDTGDAEHAAMWSRNIICFRDTPMRRVADELERWYGVRFEIDDPDLLRYTFSLRTSNLPLESLLKELENIAPIRCRIDGKTVRIVRKQ